MPRSKKFPIHEVTGAATLSVGLGTENWLTCHAAKLRAGIDYGHVRSSATGEASIMAPQILPRNFPHLYQYTDKAYKGCVVCSRFLNCALGNTAHYWLGNFAIVLPENVSM